MKKFLSVILAGIMVLSVAACSSTTTTEETEEGGEETTAEGDGTYTIGFSPYTLTNEYFTAVLDGVQKACDELGCELIYFDPQNDPTQ